jgi:hypothetical protein
MKVSDLAVAVASALALDSSQTVKIKNALDVALAADRAKDKAKDEGGLGPVEIEKKGKDKKGKDAFPDKDDKAKDAEKDDPEGTNDKETDIEGMDADKDDEAEDDIQPKESVTGGGSPAGNKGKEPAKDKKAHDAAIKVALDARDALHAARRDVETVLGVVAYDSAAEVYKAALDKLGVATDGVHPSAFATLFRMKREAVTATAPTLGSDAATVSTMAGKIKGYTRLP